MLIAYNGDNSTPLTCVGPLSYFAPEHNNRGCRYFVWQASSRDGCVDRIGPCTKLLAISNIRMATYAGYCMGAAIDMVAFVVCLAYANVCRDPGAGGCILRCQLVLSKERHVLDIYDVSWINPSVC